jgi:hypothetical protein
MMPHTNHILCKYHKLVYTGLIINISTIQTTIQQLKLGKSWFYDAIFVPPSLDSGSGGIGPGGVYGPDN